MPSTTEASLEKALKERGTHPGLVHLLSAMEMCQTYKPWHDKQTHQTFLQSDQGKCLLYSFYFIDEELGRCCLRVPTWCPLRLPFYCNGHHWLAGQLKANAIACTMRDNALTQIADWHKAQQLSEIKVYDKFSPILRIETTSNDVSFFKHYREVEQRDKTRTLKSSRIVPTRG